MLSIAKLVNIFEIFQAVSPTNEKFEQDVKEQRKVLAQRVSKAQTISTLATIQSEASSSSGLSATLNEGLSYGSSSSSTQSRAFSSVVAAQEAEDQKASGDAFKEV